MLKLPPPAPLPEIECDVFYSDGHDLYGYQVTSGAISASAAMQYAKDYAAADRRAVIEAIAEWLRSPSGAATIMDGWAIEQRMAGAMLLVQASNELRAAIKD